jgi:predicted phosphate transport protein (TIGR00153 family)
MLLKRSRDSIKSILKEHMNVVTTVVDNLKYMVDALAVLDIKKAREYANIIDTLESDADRVHRECVVKICRGSIFGYMREDILLLMERIDDVADSTKEASRAITQRGIQESMLARFLNDNTREYINASIDTVRYLVALIESLDGKSDTIIEHVKKVEQSEEYSDTLKNEVMRELFLVDVYDILTIIQLKEFVQLVDRIADSAEDASDVVLIMLAKGYA